VPPNIYLDAKVQGGIEATQHVHEDFAHENTGRLGRKNIAAPGAVVTQAARHAGVQSLQPGGHATAAATATTLSTETDGEI
jgi:hypothetical protein